MEIGPRISRPDFFMPSTPGLFFLGFGAFFYGLRYVCAALMCAGRSFTSFSSAYSEIGPDLTYIAMLFFATGAGFLLFPLYQKLDQLWTDEKFPFNKSSGKFD